MGLVVASRGLQIQSSQIFVSSSTDCHLQAQLGPAGPPPHGGARPHQRRVRLPAHHPGAGQGQGELPLAEYHTTEL